MHIDQLGAYEPTSCPSLERITANILGTDAAEFSVNFFRPLENPLPAVFASKRKVDGGLKYQAINTDKTGKNRTNLFDKRDANRNILKDADGNIVRHDEFFCEGHTGPIFKSEFWQLHTSRNENISLAISPKTFFKDGKTTTETRAIGIFDVDEKDGDPEGLARLNCQRIVGALDAMKLRDRYLVALSGGGRGFHIYIRMHERTTPEQYVYFMRTVMSEAGVEPGKVECYPKLTGGDAKIAPAGGRLSRLVTMVDGFERAYTGPITIDRFVDVPPLCRLKVDEDDPNPEPYTGRNNYLFRKGCAVRNEKDEWTDAEIRERVLELQAAAIKEGHWVFTRMNSQPLDSGEIDTIVGSILKQKFNPDRVPGRRRKKFDYSQIEHRLTPAGLYVKKPTDFMWFKMGDKLATAHVLLNACSIKESGVKKEDVSAIEQNLLAQYSLDDDLTPVARFAHYDGKAMWVDLGGRLLKMNGKTHEIVRNQAPESVVFHHNNARFPTDPIIPDKVEEAVATLKKVVEFSTLDPAREDVEPFALGKLGEAVVCFAWQLQEIMDVPGPRVILYFIADKGNAKTFTQWLFSLPIQYSETYATVMDGSERQWQNLFSKYNVICVDNVDGIPAKIGKMLCVAPQDAVLDFGKLYDQSESFCVPGRRSISLTGRELNVYHDTRDRTYVVHCKLDKPAEDIVSEHKETSREDSESLVKAEVLKMLPEYQGAMMRLAMEIRDKLDFRAERGRHREFCAIVRQVGHALGMSERDVDDLLDVVRFRAQDNDNANEDAFSTFIVERGETIGKWSDWHQYWRNWLNISNYSSGEQPQRLRDTKSRMCSEAFKRWLKTRDLLIQIRGDSRSPIVCIAPVGADFDGLFAHYKRQQDANDAHRSAIGELTRNDPGEGRIVG